MADLCTLDQVCLELGLDAGSLPDLVRRRLSNMIAGVSQAARTYTGKQWGAADFVEVFDGGCRSFNVLRLPINSVALVADVSQSPAVEQDVASYGIDYPAGLIFPISQRAGDFAFDMQDNRIPADLVETWGAGRQRWQVSYNGGAPPPDDVAMACAQWCAALKNITPGLTSERIGDYAYTTNETLTEMPGSTRLILNGYKGARVRIA